jgi:hypothetical protein
MEKTQYNNLNVPSTYFDSADTDYLLGNHLTQGQLDERYIDQYVWNCVDAEDGYLVHSVVLNL